MTQNQRFLKPIIVMHARSQLYAAYNISLLSFLFLKYWCDFSVQVYQNLYFSEPLHGLHHEFPAISSTQTLAHQPTRTNICSISKPYPRSYAPVTSEIQRFEHSRPSSQTNATLKYHTIFSFAILNDFYIMP